MKLPLVLTGDTIFLASGEARIVEEDVVKQVRQLQVCLGFMTILRAESKFAIDRSSTCSSLILSVIYVDK